MFSLKTKIHALLMAIFSIISLSVAAITDELMEKPDITFFKDCEVVETRPMTESEFYAYTKLMKEVEELEIMEEPLEEFTKAIAKKSEKLAESSIELALNSLQGLESLPELVKVTETISIEIEKAVSENEVFFEEIEAHAEVIEEMADEFQETIEYENEHLDFDTFDVEQSNGKGFQTDSCKNLKGKVRLSGLRL